MITGAYLGRVSSHFFLLFLHVKQPDRVQFSPDLRCLLRPFVGVFLSDCASFSFPGNLPAEELDWILGVVAGDSIFSTHVSFSLMVFGIQMHLSSVVIGPAQGFPNLGCVCLVDQSYH